MTKIIKRKCLTCKKFFIPLLSNVRKGHGKFCSKSCARTGKYSGHWKGGIVVKNPSKYFNEKAKEWQRKNRSIVYPRQKLARERDRIAAFIAYSGDPPKCQCCGETEIKFLSIDHIDENGRQHRRKIGTKIASWLRHNNYPSGFQILCYNCNLAKGFWGQCPHISSKSFLKNKSHLKL